MKLEYSGCRPDISRVSENMLILDVDSSTYDPLTGIIVMHTRTSLYLPPGTYIMYVGGCMEVNGMIAQPMNTVQSVTAASPAGISMHFHVQPKRQSWFGRLFNRKHIDWINLPKKTLEFIVVTSKQLELKCT